MGLRGDNIICGTSTTGTGTLTLAATPSALGAIDPYMAFGSLGLGTSVGVPIDYTIIEYADSTFTKPIQQEKGIGLLTFGANLAACTIARSLVQEAQVIGTSYNDTSPSAITIGTAANTLVFIAPSSYTTMAAAHSTPAMGAAENGIGLVGLLAMTSVGQASVTSGLIYYFPYYLVMPLAIAVARIVTYVAYTGVASNCYVGLYAFDPVTGNPGKLLADFGVLGTPGSTFASRGRQASAALATKVPLKPGWYWIAVQPIYTAGGTGGISNLPALLCASNVVAAENFTGRNGFGDSLGNYALTAPGGSAAFSDPGATPTNVVIGNSSLSNIVVGLWSS